MQHLNVRYVDEAGIEVKVDIDVSSFSLKNVPGGGTIEWRNQTARDVQPAGGGGGGGFLSKLVSDGIAAAARPSPRERARRYRPAMTAAPDAVEEDAAAADAPEVDSPAAEAEDVAADPDSV